MIRRVDLRALQEDLAACLRHVRRGDIVLVTDAGQVIAELRQPTPPALAMDSAASGLSRLADAGQVRLGRPNTPGAHGEPRVRLSSQSVREALDWVRGEDW